MTVRGRLLASFAVVTATLLIPSLYAAVRLSDLRDLAVQRRSYHASAVLATGQLEASLAELNRLQRSFVATADEELGRAARRTLQRVEALSGELQRSAYGEAAILVRPVLREIMGRSLVIDSLVAQGRLSEATSAFGRMEALFPAAHDRLSRFAETIDWAAQDEFERARSISASARRTTLFGVATLVLLALLAGAWTTGALTRPLRRLASATAEVAEGSFHAPEDLPYESRDEIGDLSRSFRIMTARLDELDRMKAEFVGVASHELKTPINVIQGYAELIEEDLAEELTGPQHEILEGIVQQTEVMARLVSRLMDISRLETGSYRLEMEEVHLEDLVTGLTRSFDLLADQKEIGLETEVRPSAPDTLVLDVDIIRDEVLGNLVANAIKHTPRKGTVRIAVWGESVGVVFEVADSGPGIPEKHRPHIFEKYYQVERSRAVGAGLGLAIAREMVQLHGGDIELTDGEGPGAVFRVYLPRTPPGTVSTGAAATRT